MRQQKFHAFSAMTPVVSVFVDVDDDEPGDREAGDGRDQLGAAFGAAAVPVQFRLTDAQAFEGFAQFGDIVVIAQSRCKEIGAGSRSGRDPDSSAQAVSMRNPSSESRPGRLRRPSGFRSFPTGCGNPVVNS